MAITPQLDKVKQMFISMSERSLELGTMDGSRLALEEMMSQFPLDDDVVFDGINAGGVAAEWISTGETTGAKTGGPVMGWKFDVLLALAPNTGQEESAGPELELSKA